MKNMMRRGASKLLNAYGNRGGSSALSRSKLVGKNIEGGGGGGLSRSRRVSTAPRCVITAEEYPSYTRSRSGTSAGTRPGSRKQQRLVRHAVQQPHPSRRKTIEETVQRRSIPSASCPREHGEYIRACTFSTETRRERYPTAAVTCRGKRRTPAGQKSATQLGAFLAPGCCCRTGLPPSSVEGHLVLITTQGRLSPKQL